MKPKQIGDFEVEVYEDVNTDKIDSFSVVINGIEVLALSGDSRFNQFVGDLEPVGRIKEDSLGERISWEETPEPVKRAVRERLEVGD